MRIFSTFSGIGGFERGIINANYASTQPIEFVGYSEIDKYAISVYERNFNGATNEMEQRGFGQEEDKLETTMPNSISQPHQRQHTNSSKRTKNYGDITKIKAEELPDFDCLVGGFPCQAFSIAGKRRGFDDTRGTLFFDLARILREKQPRLCVFENVKGLLSHARGETFRTIIATLDELGYDLQWQVLNSKDYGVPQNRERIIIVGHLRGTARPEVFPIAGNSGKAVKQIIGGAQGERVYDPSGSSVTIASQGGGLGAKTGLYVARVNRSKGEYDLKTTETAGTLTATMFKGIDASGRTGVIEGLLTPDHIGKTVRAGGRGSLTKKHNWDTIAIPVLTPDRAEKRQNGRRMKEDGDPSFTLTAQDKHGVYDGVKIRRLTPIECERLQAFPDNWTEYGINEKGEEVKISDTQRYKMLGNAVTTNVIQAVFERILG